MSKIRYRNSAARRRVTITSQLAALSLAALLLVAGCLVVASAQSGPPPTPPTFEQKKEVSAGPYRLRITSLTENQWPQPSWDFSIERADGARFESLKESDIKVLLNGQPVAVSPGSLKPQQDEPRSIYLMIDRSGSMVDTKEGLNKLEAAKKALKTFINSLGPRDSAIIATFADDQKTVQTITNVKSRLDTAAGSIAHSTSQYTHLYDAVRYALKEAADNGIKDVVILSDGREEPDPSRSDLTPLTSPLFGSYKSRREQEVIDYARGRGMRVYTIAVGVKGGKGLSWVDYESLDKLSRESNNSSGARFTHIDLLKLQGEVAAGRQSFEQLLERDLGSTLREIKKDVSFSYTLKLDLPPNLDRNPGALDLAVVVPDEKKTNWKLAASYPFHWPEGADRPRLGIAQIAPPEPVAVLVGFVEPAVPPANRVGIYLWFVLAFSVLAFIPPTAGVLTSGLRMLRTKRSIVRLGSNSPWLTKLCPSERGAFRGQFQFKVDDVVIVCTRCKTPHHLTCWKFNHYRCMRDGCTNEMLVPLKIMSKYRLA